MIAANLVFPLFHQAIAVKMELAHAIRVLMQVLQRCYNLKSGTWGVKSLGGPVYQMRLGIFRRCQFLPLLIHCIGIKIRLGYHGQNLSRVRLHGDHRPSPVSHGIGGCLLQIRIQSRYHVVSHIFLSLQLVDGLFYQIDVGGQKIKIRQGFDARLTVLSRIAYRVNIEIIIRIIPFFCTVLRHLSLCQHLSVSAQDFPSHNPVGKTIQSGIVGAVDDIFTVYLKKPSQIQAHTDKQGCEGIGNP